MHIPRRSMLPRAAGLGVALAVVAMVLPVAATATTASPAAASCGKTIKTNFTLKRDLRNCPRDGLVVGADNITIRLNGHLLDGTGKTGSAGVRIAGHSGVTVRGGVIRHFGFGVWLDGAVESQIRGNRIGRTVEEGIFANASSSRTLIQANRISGSGKGSGVTWADGIDTRGNGLRIRGNTVNNVYDDGIDVNGNRVRIVNNTVNGNGGDGIDTDGRYTIIRGNLATENGDDGVGTDGGAYKVTFKDNTGNRNVDLGVHPAEGTSPVDGGGNKASGNGDSRQCVLVKCS